MFSSSVYRSAGVVALCLLVGVFFSGALGGAQQQQPLPPLKIIAQGDPAFGPLEGQLGPTLGIMRPELDPNCDEYERKPWWCEHVWAIDECGTTIAEIFINPDARQIQDPVTAARSLDDGPILIGGIRSLDDSNHFLGTAEPLPKGDYFIWMAEAKKLGIWPWPKPFPQPPPDEIWFTFMALRKSDGKFDLKAIFYYADGKFRKPEDWMVAATPRNGIPSTSSTIPDSIWSQCCDLTVRHLSVTARKFSTPCSAPPCPAWWDILALATIANIGQIDLTEPFTVRVLLNGRLIHQEEIAGLAKGASQPILAAETVTQPGTYIVTVIVDPENKINERDETNNIAERGINLQ